MKTFKFLFAASLIYTLIVFSSCEQKEVLSSIESEAQEELLFDESKLHSKTITLTDGRNTATIKISTEESQLLDYFDRSTFIPSFEKSTNKENFNDIHEVNFLDEALVDIEDDIDRIKIFVTIEELTLDRDISFGLTFNESAAVGFRAYNLQWWYSSSFRNGLRVRCTGRGLDGLSAWAYRSGTSNCNSASTSAFASRYFYNQNSSHQDFWRQPGSPCIWVKTWHYYNLSVSYL